jgi:hypothetical protein
MCNSYGPNKSLKLIPHLGLHWTAKAGERLEFYALTFSAS